MNYGKESNDKIKKNTIYQLKYTYTQKALKKIKERSGKKI